MDTRTAATLAIAVCLVLGSAVACSPKPPADDESPVAVQPATATVETPAQAPTDEPAPTQPIAADASYQAFKDAAAMAGFAVYEPATLPAGFGYLQTETQVTPDIIGVVYASGDKRILILQGVWDLGDDGEIASGVAASFGPLAASFYRDVGYAWAPDSPEYGEDGEAVIATDGPTAYMVLGVKVSRADLLAVAAGMRTVER